MHSKVIVVQNIDIVATIIKGKKDKEEESTIIKGKKVVDNIKRNIENVLKSLKEQINKDTNFVNTNEFRNFENFKKKKKFKYLIFMNNEYIVNIIVSFKFCYFT